jgi:hypothetical protein
MVSIIYLHYALFISSIAVRAFESPVNLVALIHLVVHVCHAFLLVVAFLLFKR